MGNLLVIALTAAIVAAQQPAQPSPPAPQPTPQRSVLDEIDAEPATVTKLRQIPSRVNESNPTETASIPPELRVQVPESLPGWTPEMFGPLQHALDKAGFEVPPGMWIIDPDGNAVYLVERPDGRVRITGYRDQPGEIEIGRTFDPRIGPNRFGAPRVIHGGSPMPGEHIEDRTPDRSSGSPAPANPAPVTPPTTFTLPPGGGMTPTAAQDVPGQNFPAPAPTPAPQQPAPTPPAPTPPAPPPPPPSSSQVRLSTMPDTVGGVAVPKEFQPTEVPRGINPSYGPEYSALQKAIRDAGLDPSQGWFDLNRNDQLTFTADLPDGRVIISVQPSDDFTRFYLRRLFIPSGSPSDRTPTEVFHDPSAVRPPAPAVPSPPAHPVTPPTRAPTVTFRDPTTGQTRTIPAPPPDAPSVIDELDTNPPKATPPPPSAPTSMAPIDERVFGPNGSDDAIPNLQFVGRTNDERDKIKRVLDKVHVGLQQKQGIRAHREGRTKTDRKGFGLLQSRLLPSPDLSLRSFVSPAPSPITMLLTSLGNSTGDAFRLQVLGGNPDEPIDFESLVVEPLENIAKDGIQQLTNTFVSRGADELIARGYCLEFLHPPPVAGMLYRLAPPAVQKRFEPMRRIMGAARTLEERGDLTPDSTPRGYFDSIAQWALWSTDQKFDQAGFAKALIEHTKKNVEQSGRPWKKEMAGVIEQVVPHRWQDIQKVLRLAQQ